MANVKINKAEQIRALLKTGTSAADTAKAVGVPTQYVHDIRYKDKQRVQKKGVRISPITGKPVRKYKKRGKPLAKAEVNTVFKPMSTLYAKTLEEQNLQLKRQISALNNELQVAQQRKPIYVDMPVPQPWAYFTFWQRLKVLFLGREV